MKVNRSRNPIDMMHNLNEFKKFNGKRKFKGAAKAIIAMNRFKVQDNEHSDGGSNHHQKDRCDEIDNHSQSGNSSASEAQTTQEEDNMDSCSNKI